jgi:hypothetical protein
MADISTEEITFKLTPSNISDSKPTVLLPSFTVSVEGAGIMPSPIKVIYASLIYPGSYSPMPATFSIQGTGNKVKVGGCPVCLPGDFGETVVIFPPTGNNSPAVVNVKCEIDDPGQDKADYTG